MHSDTKDFGFWIYLMTDLVVFAALFATFIVLMDGTFGGPSGKELFSLHFALAETLILLASSFTCSLGMIFVRQMQKKEASWWFLATLLLGALFLYFEILEFLQFSAEGAIPSRSAFLSSFYTLVGTHGFHIFIGLLWMVVMLFRIWKRPLIASSISRIYRMALFWHFLDFVWIFIFTVVYGMGTLL